MIESLTGDLLGKQVQRAVIRIDGVAFELLIPCSTFSALPPEGEEATLLTHLHWREEGPQLFGFATDAERNFFRLLIKVNKVGPTLALKILSSAPWHELVGMILGENVHALTGIKGVGPKLATRLIVELRGPLAKSGLAGDAPSKTQQERMPAIGIPHEREIRDGLEHLGYSGKEITHFLRALAPTLPQQASPEELLELILRSVARTGRS